MTVLKLLVDMVVPKFPIQSSTGGILTVRSEAFLNLLVVNQPINQSNNNPLAQVVRGQRAVFKSNAE